MIVMKCFFFSLEIDFMHAGFVTTLSQSSVISKWYDFKLDEMMAKGPLGDSDCLLFCSNSERESSTEVEMNYDTEAASKLSSLVSYPSCSFQKHVLNWASVKKILDKWKCMCW